MELVIHAGAEDPSGAPVEVVERKGQGHPDTLCDAVSEAISVALARHYLERFGMVMHYNVDKVMLRGGVSRPAFGGGEIVLPIELYLCGRATHEVRGVAVPVADLAVGAAREVLRAGLHALDIDRHVRITSLIRPGSADLVELFARRQASGRWLANDTSCGVGFAPLTPHEQLVLDLERRLTHPEHVQRHPFAGEDVKVMGVRYGADLQLTVACAFIDRTIGSIADYAALKEVLRGEIESFCTARVPALRVSAAVNAADQLDEGSCYLTVTGTSGECGDDGQTGRGNRVSGLITFGRPMTMEAAAGKNPVSHVGKLYNVAAGEIAAQIVRELGGVTGASCLLVSRIGHPVDEPHLAEVRLAELPGAAVASHRAEVAEVVHAHLARLPELWRRLIDGEPKLF